MATTKQIEFFNELLSQRKFPDGTDTEALKTQFAQINDKSASTWIEKALELPEKEDTPPPF